MTIDPIVKRRLPPFGSRSCLFVVIILALSGCWNDKSTQIGTSYAITSLLLDPSSCVTEPVDPANPDPNTDPVDCKTVYVATAGGGIFKSLDGGGSWARIVNGLIEWNISKMVMDPKDPMTLYIGTENNGLFKTNDGGANWFSSGTAGTITGITAIAIDPHTCLSPPCTDIYVGSQDSGSGVWVSRDIGLSWTQMNTGLAETNVTAFTIFSYNKFPSDLYAGTEEGHLYKFNQTGNKWEEALPGLSEKTVASPLVIAVNPLAPAGSELYVGTGGGEGQTLGGTFRSIDGGATWNVVPIPNAQNYSVRVLTFCLQVEPQCPPTLPDTDDPPENDPLRESDILYAGVYGLSKTAPAGGVWTNIDTGLIQSGNNVSSLAIDVLRHTTLYAGTLSGFVIKCQTDCQNPDNWKRIDINL